MKNSDLPRHGPTEESAEAFVACRRLIRERRRARMKFTEGEIFDTGFEAGRHYALRAVMSSDYWPELGEELKQKLDSERGAGYRDGVEDALKTVMALRPSGGLANSKEEADRDYYGNVYLALAEDTIHALITDPAEIRALAREPQKEEKP